MEQRQGHPLDIDLFGLVVGDIDATLAAEVTEHLSTCLLCRVRIARIRRGDAIPAAPPVAIDFPTVSPRVLAALESSARPEVIATGQIWLAGDSNRLLLWVRAVQSGAVVAHPITLDIDAADDTALIIDDLPALGHSGAVVTSIVGTVPVSQLVSYIGDLDISADVQRLRDAATVGTAVLDLPTGRPITGPTDERLEFRQLLADDLAALDVIEGEDDDDDYHQGASDTLEVAAREMVEALRSDLLGRRGPGCELRTVLDDLLLGSFAQLSGCVPVVVVSELNASILLITGVDPVAWVVENQGDASKLLRRSRATALAIAEQLRPFDTWLFEERHLHPALELPQAMAPVAPRPMSGAKPLVKALYDYFEDDVFAVDPVAPLAAESNQRELSPYLEAKARSRLDALRATRAQLTKNTALKSLAPSDADAVAAALETAGDIEQLLGMLDGITDR